MDSRCNSTQRGRLEKFQNNPQDRPWGPELAQVNNNNCLKKSMMIEPFKIKVSMIVVFLHIVDHLYPAGKSLLTEPWVKCLEEEIRLWENSLHLILGNMKALTSSNMRV